MVVILQNIYLFASRQLSNDNFCYDAAHTTSVWKTSKVPYKPGASFFIRKTVSLYNIIYERYNPWKTWMLRVIRQYGHLATGPFSW